ncbi:MAG: hypothetical protein ACHQAY_22925 [Hyphomicrobiales bacterium]
MPSAKTQTPPANLGVGKHEIQVLSRSGRRASRRSGRPYIALAATCVIIGMKAQGRNAPA